MNMIQKMQNHVAAQRIDLLEMTDTMNKIKAQRNVVVVEQDIIIIERNETIQKLNEARTMIHFLQNDLAKQQNQLSID